MIYAKVYIGNDLIVLLYRGTILFYQIPYDLMEGSRHEKRINQVGGIRV